MNRDRIILILGVLLALMPVLGFPYNWEVNGVVIIGLILVGVSLQEILKAKDSTASTMEEHKVEKQENEPASD